MKTLATILLILFISADKFIVLTERQAKEIQGRHGRYSELQPVKLVSGEYVLPVKVLDDPEFEKVATRLKRLPRREVKPEEFPKSE